MCLITEQRFAKIAKDDIIVYKRLYIDNDKLTSTCHTEHHWLLNLLYKTKLIIERRNKLTFKRFFKFSDTCAEEHYSPFINYKLMQHENSFFNHIGDLRYPTKPLTIVHEGYHAYKSLNRSNLKKLKIFINSSKISDYYLYHNYQNVFIAIIPKGAEYFEDATGLIVSNELIIKEEFNGQTKILP